MKKSGNIIFTIAYLAMAIPMFSLPKQGFFIGSFGVEYKYLLAIGIIALSLLHFLITGDLRKAVRCLKDSAVFLYPYIFCIIYSLLLWVFTEAGFSVMTRGFFYIFYQVIAVLAAAGTLYMFGRKGIYLQMFALTVSMGLMVLDQVSQVGAGEFARQYFNNIITFTADSGSTMRFFEKQGHVYATGIFLVYFILTIKEDRVNIFWAVVSFLLFFLGLKRSVFLGVSIGLLIGLLFSWVKRPTKWIVPITLIEIGLVLGYIILVYNGLFDWLETIGISTSGRNLLYDRIRDFYSVSPGYFGKGAGFVARAFENGVFDTSLNGFSVGDIHNEYLRQYIDYGFWGFLIWFWLYTANRIKHFCHTGTDALENRHGCIAFTLLIVNCVMFMTENCLYYYYSTMVLATTIMGYHYEDFVKRTKIPGEET